MSCLKCGREIRGDQVFCPDCLEEMKQYPVSSTATVRLPRRPEAPVSRKAARRKSVSEEEQIRHLKKWIRILTWVLAAAIVVIIILTIPTVKHLVEESITLLPGQNYSSAASSTGTG